MHKKIVRTLSAILCSGLLLGSFTGCQKSTDQSGKQGDTASKKEASSKLETLEFTRANYFGDASDYPELKDEFMKEFEKKFGVKLKVNPIARNNFLEKTNLMIASGELKGLVNMFGSSDVLKAMDDGTIEPLDDYLKDNEFWKSMPDSYKNMYKYNGKTWAVPFAFVQRCFTRTIRKDWLDKVGMKAPETVDELMEVAKAFTEKDPDGNGKNDTVGLTSSKLWNLQDVFQAFGARLNTTGDLSITYDPDANGWIDTMLKPEMVDALKYLNSMYQKGYLDKELFTNKSSNLREKFWGSKAGSMFYWDGWGYTDGLPVIKKTVPTADVVEVVALKGKQTKNLNFTGLGNSPVVLLKGTKQPKETINTYLDIFANNEEANLMGRFGLPGKTYKKEGNRIIQIKDPNTKAAYPSPFLSGEVPNFSQSKYPVVVEGTADEMANFEQITKKRLDTIKDGFDKGLLFQMTYEAIVSNTYTKQSADITRVFDEVMVKAIAGQIPVEQAIKEYREKMKALNADKILEETNAAYGTTPKTITKY